MRIRYCYTVERPYERPPMVFAGAFKAVAFAFGPDREKSKTAGRVAGLRKGESCAVFVAPGSPSTFVHRTRIH